MKSAEHPTAIVPLNLDSGDELRSPLPQGTYESTLQRHYYPRQRSSVAENTELTMGREVVLEIRVCVSQRHAVILEQGVDLEPRIQPQQTPNLAFGQRAGAIALDSKRFECLRR
jgi:hypothetical protein